MIIIKEIHWLVRDITDCVLQCLHEKSIRPTWHTVLFWATELRITNCDYFWHLKLLWNITLYIPVNKLPVSSWLARHCSRTELSLLLTWRWLSRPCSNNRFHASKYSPVFVLASTVHQFHWKARHSCSHIPLLQMNTTGNNTKELVGSNTHANIFFITSSS